MRKRSTPAACRATVALAREAHLHLICKNHGPASLARALGIPRSDLDPILKLVEDRFAQDGVELRLVCRGRRRRFEVRGYQAFLERAWDEFHHSLKRVWEMPDKPGRFSREDAAIYRL